MPKAKRDGLYVQNREPLTPAPFMKLPIGAIQPRGWLRHQLELEAQGMVGRLPEISPWLNFSKSSWAAADGSGNYGWEEMPYWLKGFGDLAYGRRLGYFLVGRSEGTQQFFLLVLIDFHCVNQASQRGGSVLPQVAFNVS